MKTNIPPEILAANGSIGDAERALKAALAAINASPRAEKVTVSRAVEDAFERLRAARAILEALAASEDADEPAAP